MGTRGWLGIGKLEIEALEALTTPSSPDYPHRDSDLAPGSSDVNEYCLSANIRCFVTRDYGLLP
jgi:hypothetical protein